MTRERYESLPLATLKELAKARNMKGVSTLKKSALIDEMLKLDETEKQMQANEKAKEEVRQEMKEKKEESDIEQLDSGKTAKGIFELHQDGYGFIQTFLQYIAGAGSLPLSSQYDDVVRSRLCFRAELPEDHSF